MKYTMKAGVLYQEDRVTARIKSSFAGPAKKVLSAEGRLLLQTDICNMEAPPDRQGDVRFRKYTMTVGQGVLLAAASPDYAGGDDPMAGGWPICRLPKVDRAQVNIDGVPYYLTMRNSQHYLLRESPQKVAIQILHRGLIGGWDIEAAEDFGPELICGIFIFCRYIERENEFLIV